MTPYEKIVGKMAHMPIHIIPATPLAKPILGLVESVDTVNEEIIILTEHGTRYKANAFYASDLSGRLQIREKHLLR